MCIRDSADAIPAGIQSFLRVADYMIAYKFNQSDTERAGRNMNLTKTTDRASLGDENFKRLVWISYNSPQFHEVDFEPIVAAWLKTNHKLALFKGGGTSRVLERMQAQHKVTLLH